MTKAVPCRVEEVGPQVHEQVGAAERAVRSLKERLACLKLDLMHEGLELILDAGNMDRVVRYIAMIHNMFRTVHGSRRTPVQKVLGQDRQPLVMSLIASTVFAEVPESVAAPAGSRFIPAAYLGPSYSSRASFVSGLVGPIGQQEVKVFQAKSVRLLK